MSCNYRRTSTLSLSLSLIILLAPASSNDRAALRATPVPKAPTCGMTNCIQWYGYRYQTVESFIYYDYWDPTAAEPTRIGFASGDFNGFCAGISANGDPTATDIDITKNRYITGNLTCSGDVTVKCNYNTLTVEALGAGTPTRTSTVKQYNCQ